MFSLFRSKSPGNERLDAIARVAYGFTRSSRSVVENFAGKQNIVDEGDNASLYLCFIGGVTYELGNQAKLSSAEIDDLLLRYFNLSQGLADARKTYHALNKLLNEPAMQTAARAGGKAVVEWAKGGGDPFIGGRALLKVLTPDVEQKTEPVAPKPVAKTVPVVQKPFVQKAQVAKEPRNAFEAFKQTAQPILFDGYRRIAAERSCAPTASTSDEEIVSIYQRVGTAFKEAAKERGEYISAGFLNTIVLHFYQIKEQQSASFFADHIKYEVRKYKAEGLREDYRKEILLFKFDVS